MAHPSIDVGEKAVEEGLRLCALAEQQIKRGDRLSAMSLAIQALQGNPDCFAAHILLANVRLDGQPDKELLALIHGHFRPRAYFEIGVETGRSLQLASAETQAIGVDPNPQIEVTLQANHKVYRETSDHFFSRTDFATEFKGTPVDLAFVDGMHQFEYALRDFINIERNAHAATRVLLHDCYPLDGATAARERRTTFWTGDVWKVIVCLKKYRPDLSVHTFGAPPTGLALVRGLDQASRVLSENYESLCSEFVPMPYEAVAHDKPGAFNLVPGRWEIVRQLMA